ASKVEKVTKVILVDDQDKEWDQAVLDDKVTFVASEYENILGEKNTDKDEDGKPVFTTEAPKVESAKSSDVTVAYFAGGKIKVVKDGTVTFEVKFEGVEDTVKVPVTVKAKQTLTSIKTDAAKVKADEDTDIKFTVLDED